MNTKQIAEEIFEKHDLWETFEKRYDQEIIKHHRPDNEVNYIETYYDEYLYDSAIDELELVVLEACKYGLFEKGEITEYVLENF